MTKKTLDEKAAVLMAIRPEYVKKISEGIKTFELRRKVGRELVEGEIPLIVVYSSAPIKSIVGIIKVLKVHQKPLNELWRETVQGAAGVSYKEYSDYFKGLDSGFAIEIKEYYPIRPLPLKEIGIKRPPQNYQFIDIFQLGHILFNAEVMEE